MCTSIAFFLISMFAYTTPGQDSASSQPAPDVEPLAVASIHVDKHRFESGEDIEVMIFLEARRLHPEVVGTRRRDTRLLRIFDDIIWIWRRGRNVRICE